MGILDQYGIGWAARAPWDPAPAPVAPGSLAPFDQGAPPSVQGGDSSIPPWEHRPVPDLAGATQAGADIAAQAQATQPEMLPSEPVPGEIEVTPAESDANQLKFNPSAAPQPDSVGLVDPYPVGGRPAPAPQPDSIGLIDPYPPGYAYNEQPGEPVDVAGYPEEPDPSAMPGHPIDPYGAPPFDIAGKFRDFMVSRGAVADPTMGAQPLDPYAGPADPNDPKALAQRAPLDPYDPGAIDGRREVMAKAYADATPEERAAMDAREAALYATKRQTMEMQQAEADRKAVEDNARIAKQAREKAARDMAQLQADAQGMADSSPFESWWADKSTAGKMGGVVSAMFSGLMNPHGPNGAIDMMMKLADDGAAQKWKKIEARRQLLGEQRAANADDAAEREKIRLASREQAIRMIEAQMNGLDPEGTQALALGHTIAGLRAQDAQALQAYQADREKAAIAQGKVEVDAYNAESQRIQAEAQMLNAQSLDRQRGGRSGGGGGAGGGPGGTSGTGAGAWGDKAIQTGAAWAEHFRWPKDWEQPPAEKMNGKEARAWFDQQKSNAQADVNITRDKGLVAAQIREAKKFNVDNRLTFNGKPLYVYGDDGKVSVDPVTGEPEILIVPSASREEMQKKLANAAQVLAWIGEAQSIRDGASTVDLANPKSAVSQRLDQLAVSSQLAMKDGTQGMSSDADGTNLAKAAGVANLRSVFSVDASLEAARRSLINKVNNDLRNQFSYTGPPLLTEEPVNKKPPRRENEFAAVLSARVKSDAAHGNGHMEDSPMGPKWVPDMTGAQKAKLAQAEAALDVPNHPDAQEAAAGLATAATKGQFSAASEAAAQLLWSRRQKGNPAAIAAYNALSKGDRATLIANLPPDSGWDAVTGQR